ncbi:MAG: hypothetical protein ABH871_07735 [Pseudomonadota bacterium]
MRHQSLIVSLALFLLFAAYGSALAGGPFVVDMVNNTGVAQRWVGDKMTWCADEGKLSNSVNNTEAVQWINEQLAKWTGVTLKNASGQMVSTATIKTGYDPTCAVGDIDGTNYDAYVYTSEGPSVVIFDDTGDIVADLVGEQNRNAVVGLSQPIASDSSGLHITKGVAIFNGLLLENDVLSSDQSTAQELFKSTVLHELGHLLNLDHSQVNFDVAKACVRGGTCDNSHVIPTMYPELLTPMQGTPIRDDTVTLSWIYPSSDFEDGFCTITGEIFDADGKALKGVNVIASSALGGTAPMVDSRAFVSGVLKPSCYGDSRYYLHGIKPGIPYKVTYEAIGSEFTGASDFEPLDNPPRGFPSGTIQSPGGDTTVSCSEGGQTIEMASVNIDTPNPCAGSQEAAGEQVETTGSEGGGCSLVQ